MTNLGKADLPSRGLHIDGPIPLCYNSFNEKHCNNIAAVFHRKRPERSLL